MRPEAIPAVSVAPVSLSDLREWLSFQAGVVEDNDVLQTVLLETIGDLERETWRLFAVRTVTFCLDASEIGDVLRFPIVPVHYVSSITTTDSDGTETAVTSTEYQVTVGDESARVALADSGAWPSDYRSRDSMRITAEVGYAPRTGRSEVSASAVLDDLVASGTYTGTTRGRYEVEVDATGAPDTIKWRKVTIDAKGAETNGDWTTGVSLTGSGQLLAEGVYVTAAATTGHTLADAWTVEVYAYPLPRDAEALLKGLVQHSYATKGRGVLETVSGQVIGIPYQFQRMVDRFRQRSSWQV